ncbi:putative zinc finger protein 702 [Gigantopelta aegis]|uniref:putative zinc finger protein 702 n=1 Tax=Gigantopelta aegis TaxID=1735272 RepID=UPI001B88E16B|nr:putative zinc finger protein 702 [Gigantopelta aegis]
MCSDKMSCPENFHQVSLEPCKLSPPDVVILEDTQSFMLAGEAQTIVQEEHGNCLKCKKCSCVFMTRWELKQHARMHHRETCYCNICGRRFDYKRSLREHMLNHEGKRKFPCPYNTCGKSFARKAHMLDHLNGHSGIKPYTCDRCHKQFGGKYTFLGHVKQCKKGGH